MKIPAQQLKAVLRKAQSVLPGTLIFAGPKVYAVGQNITMIAGLPVDLGTFAVSTEKFSQIAGRLDGDVGVTLDTKLKITAGKSRFTLPVIAEFTVPKLGSGDLVMSTLLKPLIAMLDFASQACKKEVFNYTGSVLFTSEQAVGTDGARMMVACGAGPRTKDILLPLPVIHALKTLEGEKVTIAESESDLCFQTPQASLVARKLAKTFPSFESIIPKTFKSKHKVSAPQMLAGIRRISPLLAEDDKRILLTFSADSVILSVSNNSGSAEDVIDCEQLEPDPAFEVLPDYGFSLDYGALVDFYGAVSGDSIVCGNGPANPVWIEAGTKKLLCASKG